MKLLILVSLMNIAVHTSPRSLDSIQAYLVSHGAPEHRARQVARHILTESRRWSADPAMVTALVTVENHRLVSDTASTAGAQGVMQIMPFWTKSFGRRCGTNLHDDRTNICYGIHVLQTFLRDRGTEERALLAYNGCRTLERCGHYPNRVLSRRDAVRQTLIEF
jgi:soluble lytic murein transglycosylase-like protein